MKQPMAEIITEALRSMTVIFSHITKWASQKFRQMKRSWIGTKWKSWNQF